MKRRPCVARRFPTKARLLLLSLGRRERGAFGEFRFEVVIVVVAAATGGALDYVVKAR
jgi:hypothetical protein